MTTQNHQTLSRVFNGLAEELDVPPSKYEDAKERYEAVGAWLGDDDSALVRYNPVISPQGSFALGTAVRPLGGDDYDVDAVCELQLTPQEVAQQQLKAMVGNRLKHPESRYRDMIEPPQGGRRCWTIKYADSSKFHLDVLPAIPDDFEWLLDLGVPYEWACTAIKLTDRKAWEQGFDWPRSNPKGYAAWFKDRMHVTLAEAKLALARAERAEVEEIEDFRVRTPLQRLVQILKRHRDKRYNGDADKPISIIITTLAAQAYSNETDLMDALLQVVPKMRRGVERRDGVPWVANPVNPEENFADKWVEKPRKATLFFEWLSAVEREGHELLADTRQERLVAYLSEHYGKREADIVLAKLRDGGNTVRRLAAVAPTVLVPSKTVRQPTTVNQPRRPSKPWRG